MYNYFVVMLIYKSNIYIYMKVVLNDIIFIYSNLRESRDYKNDKFYYKV